MADSIFTKIINKEIPAKIRYEDDNFIVIDDINPVAPVHVLIITKKPFETLESINSDDELNIKFIPLVRKIAKQLGIQENYKFFMNVGKRVQQVPHVHLHLYGGWKQGDIIRELD